MEALEFRRWVLIYYPGSSDRIFTRTKSKLYISLCWLLPLCMLLPSVSGVFGYHGLKCSTRSCTLLRDSNGHSPKPLFYIVGLILPCTVLSITNILLDGIKDGKHDCIHDNGIDHRRSNASKEMNVQCSSHLPGGLRVRLSL